MKNFRYIIVALCLAALSLIPLYHSHEETELTECADQYLWDNFHQGNYDSIPSILHKLHEVKIKYPENADVTAHLGFIYLWGFSERSRKSKQDPAILKNVFLSNYYFKEAIRLNPDDPRLFGFQAATDICEGALSKNYRLILKGYATGFNSIKKWPQFNKFAVSLVSSQLNRNSLLYKLAVKYQWELVDDCSCKTLDKETILKNPDAVFSALMTELASSRDMNTRRACWNSWIAPHNLEGFFLNFGDMLVKDGKTEEAKIIYSAAKLAPSYNDWVYKPVLEQRLNDIALNKTVFDKRPELLDLQGNRQIFINSEFSCMGCHQMSKNEFEMFGINASSVSN